MTFTDLARRLIPKTSAPVEPVAAPAAPPPPPPVATAYATGRVEYNGLLWHPVVGVAEEARLIVSAKAGLPHCGACDAAMSLAGGRDWACPACGRKASGADADFYSMDHVTGEWLAEYLREHPDHAPAPGLPVLVPAAA